MKHANIEKNFRDGNILIVILGIKSLVSLDFVQYLINTLFISMFLYYINIHGKRQ